MENRPLPEGLAPGEMGEMGMAPCPYAFMTFDPEIHHRRSVRLRGYHYSSPGSYYVTICTNDKGSLFGRVIEGQMYRNDFGGVAHEEWFRSAKLRDDIALDAFMVMPNHIHGIMVRRDPVRGAAAVERFGQPVAGSLPALVRAYKSAVTQGINKLRKTPGETVWQRGYYEHIVRSDVELNGIREYIATNPLRWGSDRYNTERGTSADEDFDG